MVNSTPRDRPLSPPLLPLEQRRQEALAIAPRCGVGRCYLIWMNTASFAMSCIPNMGMHDMADYVIALAELAPAMVTRIQVAIAQFSQWLIQQAPPDASV